MSALARQWAHARGRRYGEWMWCYSGRHFYPLDPRAEEVHIDDIAHGLSCEGRYAGQARDYYSVAEHSVLVSIFAGRLALQRGWSPADAKRAARLGLLHDGTEAYIGDIIRPLKYQRELRGFRKLEPPVERAIFEALGVSPTPRERALVTEIDSRILTDEIAVLIRDPDMNDVRKKFGPPLGAVIRCLPPRAAEAEFHNRYLEVAAA